PDDDEISFKWCDYSEQSINNLIIKGMEDTLKVLTEESLMRNKEIQDELESFNDGVQNEKQNLGERYLKLLVDKAISVMPT
ncbi:MAG: hypothetical protein WB975_14115, partial [Nitrososphaeraceae archaeon]